MIQLVDRPYYLSWEQIANLTDRQVVEVFYRPRDKDGTPLPPEPAKSEEIKLEPVSTLEQRKAAYFEICARFGMPPDAAQKKWESELPRVMAEMTQLETEVAPKNWTSS